MAGASFAQAEAVAADLDAAAKLSWCRLRQSTDGFVSRQQSGFPPLKSCGPMAKSGRQTAILSGRLDHPLPNAEPILPSRRLDRVASVLKAGRGHAIGDIADRFGRPGFGFVIILLALPALIPIPGPFGFVFGSCLALVSLQVLAGAERLWLPQRVRSMQLDGGRLKSGIGHAAGWLRWTEKWVRPGRGPRWVLRHLGPAAGLPVLLLAVIVAIPIPFGNILPCLALLFLALGLIAEDGLALVAGLALGLVSVVWTLFLFFAGSSLAGSVLAMAGWH